MRHGWLIVAVFLVGVAMGEPASAEDEEAKKDDAGAVSAAKAEKPADSDDGPKGELGLKAARWRLEMYLGTGTPSGHRSRDGDFHLRTAVDYEIPVLKHMTVAPRLLPFTYINESGFDGQTLYAFGFGVALRGYSNGEEQRGWFGEGSLNVFAQTEKFTGNSGTFNFMEEFGVGYMFKSRWHVAAKINHISNAGLAEHNAGLNSAGLGVGYTFRAR